MTAAIRCSAIRFVGGPWHNRIVDVPLREAIYVPHDARPCVGVSTGPIVPPPDEWQTQYTLHQFYTGWLDVNGRPTCYWQYIHYSLRDGPNDVDLSAYNEVFTPLDYSIIRTFDQALRGCFHLLRGWHVDGRDDWDWPPHGE